MSNIEFGTDGWRAVLGKDFNYENTDKVINAIACYIFSEEKFNSKIIIGYDPRNKADEFASYIVSGLVKFIPTLMKSTIPMTHTIIMIA